jgi:hypothetical protein
MPSEHAKIIPMRRDPDDAPTDRWSDRPIGDLVDRHLALLIFIALWVVGNSVLMVWLHV